MQKKVFGWAVVAFLFFYVAHHPADAATTMRGLGSGLAAGARGVGDFFAALAQGGGTT